MLKEQVQTEIKQYLQQIVAQHNFDKLENDTSLITGGFIDSISTLKLVDYLEKKFKIEFQPHEVDRENLDTIDLMTKFILSKL